MIDNSTWWLLLGLLFVGIALFVVRIHNERERQRQVEAELDRQLMALRTKPRPVSSKTDDLNSLLQQATKTEIHKSNRDSRAWATSGNARRDTPHDGGMSIHNPLHPHSPFTSAHRGHESISDHTHGTSCNSRSGSYDPSPSSGSYSSSDSGSSSSSSSSCD
jgi:hypothetical protein